MNKVQTFDLCKTFNSTQALKNVSLTFEENKIYGLLGRNGAGKSTLLNIISSRIFPSSGNVSINDKDIQDYSYQLSDIYVVGENNLFPQSDKVGDVFKWTNEFFSDFGMDLAHSLSREFQLPLNKKVQSLSTGYLTILKDIIGLCVNTQFVFFDEPVLGLDANHRDMFYKNLIKCYMNNNSTFVISTHLIDEVADIVEKVIIIDEGEIIRNTSCEELLSMGYTVSGTSEKVDAFIKDKKVIGEDILGNMKAAYILCEDSLPQNTEVEISNINLQKLFIELTKKEAEK